MKKSAYLGLCFLFFTSSLHAEDLLPAPATSTVNERMDQEIAKRRTMLNIHQAMGLTTLTLLTATAVLGQLNYNDMINGAGNGTYQTPHKILAYTSAGAFLTTGLLSLLAPQPFKKENHKMDTGTLHKWTMILAAAAMAAQIGLGISARSSRGTPDEASLAKVHLGLGYATLGLTAVGASFWLF